MINMGRGYWILIWDSWGSGLHKVNARLLEEFPNPDSNEATNWFSFYGSMPSDAELIEKHNLRRFEHWEILWYE